MESSLFGNPFQCNKAFLTFLRVEDYIKLPPNTGENYSLSGIIYLRGRADILLSCSFKPMALEVTLL